MSAPWTRRSPRIAEKPAASLPQTAAGTLFNVTGGKVRILGVYGEVTTVIQTQANASKLQFVSTTPGATTDLCATLDITAKAVGSVFSIVGVLATAMKVTTNNLVVPADDIPAPGVVLGIGAIKLNCAASNTGAVKWTVLWIPIDSGANVAFAA